MKLARTLLALLLPLLLMACGGGGGSTSPATSPTATATPTPTPTPTAAANTVPVVLDGGPAALDTGANGYTAINTPYVTITICAPGSTSNCQTIDHVILDTGSVGLRIPASVLNASLLAALPTQADASNNPVGECYQYVSSYAFGSVRTIDFTIGGEQVASMPFQVIGDTGTFAAVPSSCSSGGGSPTVTIQDLGGNAILGVGTTATDCGSLCAVPGGQSGAIYYDCPQTGCATTIARAAATSAPFEQLPNPVAAFAADNNGTIITLPSVPENGETSATGTLVFGIGTQSDNALTAANVLPVTTSSSSLGPGYLSVTFNGATLTQSYLDTGSAFYYFEDRSLPDCASSEYPSFFCPTSPTQLSPTITGTNGAAASGAFTLYSPLSLLSTANIAPGIGYDIRGAGFGSSDSFAFGLPFFFGRTVFTAIEGRTAGTVTGPYFAF